MCIACRSKANTDKVMHEVKGKSLEMIELFANITYYKLRTRIHFVYYIIGLGGQGYRIGGIEEILDQSLVIPEVSAD